jgi:hypothetical protein
MALPSSTYDTATLVNPGSSLTDFTLIVDLSRMSAAWWAAVDTSDGTKGRAAKDSGPTELACDWIDFDNVAETGLLRVKWSGTLSSSGTQTLRIYPPQSGNASVAANATYGSDNAYDSDWAAYWPLHDANDRTANGYDLTAQGGVTLGGATGKLGAATDFDGTDDRLDYTSGAITAPGTAITWMAWIEPDANNSTRSIIYQRDLSGNHYERLAVLITYFRSNEYDGSTAVSAINLSSTVTLDTWQFVALERASSTDRRVWRNANRGNSATTDVTATGVDSTYVGGASYGGEYIDGALNHVQMHSTNRDPDWIEYEYDQTNDQATFWGTWTNVPVASTTTSSGAGTALPAIMYHRRMMGVS